MKKFFLIFTFIFCSIGWSSASTIVVCQTSVLPNGLVCTFNDIQKAINYAKPKDIIKVYGGFYKENLFIDKPLTLLGFNLPVIDADHKGDVIKSTASNVKIEGFVIENSGRSDIQDLAGVKFIAPDTKYVENCTVANNIIKNNFFGIWMGNVKGCIIKNNIIKGPLNPSEVLSGNGVHLWHCKHMLVANNNISGHRDAIYLEFTSESEFIGNTCKDNLRYGIHFMYSSDDIYMYNIFTDNQTGGAVMYSKRVYMKYNKFSNSWGPVSYGLLLKTMDDCYIYGNIFKNDTTAIIMDEGERTKIISNNFINNGVAIDLHQSDSTDNIFEWNNFISNTFDVSADGFMHSHNRFKYNYWSDYTGYDLDKDGIGDVPFVPVKLISVVSQQVPSSLILLKSFFAYLLNYMQAMIPTLVPDVIKDTHPLMKPVKIKRIA